MTTPAPIDDKAIEKALAHHAAHQADYLEELKKLVRIPSVSFEGFDKHQVRRSADATCDLMRRNGLTNGQTLEMPGAHPYAYRELTQAKGRPAMGEPAGRGPRRDREACRAGLPAGAATGPRPRPGPRCCAPRTTPCNPPAKSRSGSLPIPGGPRRRTAASSRAEPPTTRPASW